MKSTKPVIFQVSHRLAEKAEQMWIHHVALPHHGRWRLRPSGGEWKKRDWALIDRAFHAGARWMLKPFQQVCGFDRQPPGKDWTKALRAVHREIRSEDWTLAESLSHGWNCGRVFLELWIQAERFPLK